MKINFIKNKALPAQCVSWISFLGLCFIVTIITSCIVLFAIYFNIKKQMFCPNQAIPNMVVCSVTEKITYCQDDFLIYRYDLSFVYFEEFFLQFNITERNASSPMKKMINATQTAMIQYDDQETQKNTKYQVKKFNSKRGLFWYANLTIITSADGSFCIFDKNNTDEHLITIKPDRQTRDKFDVILKNCSLTESKNDSCVFWQYLPFSYQKQTAIDSTTIWFEAYSSPPHSSDFIANSELIMLASIAISMRSKKYTKRTLKITNYRTAAIDIKFRILIV